MRRSTAGRARFDSSNNVENPKLNPNPAKTEPESGPGAHGAQGALSGTPWEGRGGKGGVGGGAGGPIGADYPSCFFAAGD